MRVAVIGGGAAGFFAAISVKGHHANAEVVLFEKTSKTLSKVKISGGGRCNVTHHCTDQSGLPSFYPRGKQFLKKAFHQFSVTDTINWFESRGVQLKVESDNRMFPKTDSSQSIVDALESAFFDAGCIIKTKSPVSQMLSTPKGIQLVINGQELLFDKVIVASGGSPKKAGLDWLAQMGHKIAAPVPSLFTFNMPQQPITELMGAVAPDSRVRIVGEKLDSIGPLLITHWGMSGPAILKLSAFGARILANKDYHFQISVSWVNTLSEEILRTLIYQQKEQKGMQQLSNFRLEGLPKRVWWFLLKKIDLPVDKRWIDISKKDVNRMVNILLNDEYNVRGKTTFKEEFVTCGGVSLNDVSANTLQSKKVPNLYFAGEVLDIDGVTGGFNFQSAWTTGYIAGKLN